MTGPALKKAASHATIHEAALGEAEQLTELVRRFLKTGDETNAYQAATIALEHWESRTLAHAGEEENGLYLDIVREYPDQRERVAALTRDHDLMRALADQIRDHLSRCEVTRAVLSRFEALIWIDLLHNDAEEQLVESLGWTT